MNNLFDSGDVFNLFKSLQKEIKKLKCFVEECCEKIPINIGNGYGLFKQLYRGYWQFKSIVAGNNVTITEQENTITIHSSGGGSSFNCSDLNTCSTDNLPEGSLNLYFTDSRAISALTGENISIFTNNAGYITLFSLSAGTGISYNNLTGVITNSLPDQTVVLSNGTGISTSGTYPNFTITNTAPDQTVSLSSGSGINVSGTYPNFTITNTSPSSGGTVTSVATGTGLTGGTITTSGTVSLNSKLSPLDTLTGNSLKLLRVNAGETAVEYFTPSYGTGTVTSVSALTLGTTGTDLSSTVANSTTTPVITLNVPTASSTNRGALSSSDWTTFNSKIGGSGTLNEIAYFSGTSTLSSLNTATYPSLTELSYVKGVSSAIQTQINTKEPTITTLATSKGGTNLNTSSSTGVAQVSSGTWSVSTALANGTTATTQSASDNSTKVATTAYTDTAVSAKSSSIFGGIYGTITASVTRYANIGVLIGTVQSSESLRQAIMCRTGTFSKMYITTSSSQPASGSLVITLRKNSANSGVTVTIAAGSAAGTFSDTTHSSSFVAGDLYSIEYVNNATTTSATVLSVTLKET